MQKEMREKGRCGMLAMENVCYREAIDKKNIELEVVKEKLREKQECLTRAVTIIDEKEEKTHDAMEELETTKEKLVKHEKL